VHSAPAELGAHHAVCAGKVNVPLAGECHAVAGETVLLVKAADQFGELLFCHLQDGKESLELVPADCG